MPTSRFKLVNVTRKGGARRGKAVLPLPLTEPYVMGMMRSDKSRFRYAGSGTILLGKDVKMGEVEVAQSVSTKKRVSVSRIFEKR